MTIYSPFHTSNYHDADDDHDYDYGDNDCTKFIMRILMLLQQNKIRQRCADIHVYITDFLTTDHRKCTTRVQHIIQV